jgi:hypothetical protein
LAASTRRSIEVAVETDNRQIVLHRQRILVSIIKIEVKGYGVIGNGFHFMSFEQSDGGASLCHHVRKKSTKGIYSIPFEQYDPDGVKRKVGDKEIVRVYFGE